MFHFHSFDDTKSGEQNYDILRSKVAAALNGSVAAKAEVTAWVWGREVASTSLLDRADVQHVYYAVGTASTEAGVTLEEGWAETLRKTGKLGTLDTELGVWSKAKSSKFTCNRIHNSLIHVTLDVPSC